MGSIFSGLVQTGAWGCFDEFSRIDVEVLSDRVVSSQLQTIQTALNLEKTRFEFLGKEINIRPSVGYFITMNPGYAGRTELPDNLKALFRPVTMIVPDLMQICEIMLFSEGFNNARSLALKMTHLYRCLQVDTLVRHFGNMVDGAIVPAAEPLIRAGDITQGTVLYGPSGQPVVVDEVPVTGAAEQLYCVQQQGAMEYSVTKDHFLYLEWRRNPTVSFGTWNGDRVLYLRYRSAATFKHVHIGVKLAVDMGEDDGDMEVDDGAPAISSSSSEQVHHRQHFETEADAKAAGQAWVAAQAKLFLETDGAQGCAKRSPGGPGRPVGKYKSPIVLNFNQERHGNQYEAIWKPVGSTRQHSMVFSWGKRQTPPGEMPIFVSVDDAYAYLNDKLAALPAGTYLEMGTRFTIEAQVVAQFPPSFFDAAYGVMGVPADHAYVDAAAGWVFQPDQLHRFGLVGLNKVDALRQACVSLPNTETQELRAAHYGLLEMPVCDQTTLCWTADGAVVSADRYTRQPAQPEEHDGSVGW
jgi:hypothetical protein